MPKFLIFVVLLTGLYLFVGKLIDASWPTITCSSATLPSFCCYGEVPLCPYSCLTKSITMVKNGVFIQHKSSGQLVRTGADGVLTMLVSGLEQMLRSYPDLFGLNVMNTYKGPIEISVVDHMLGQFIAAINFRSVP